jgi:hypothetical protein
MRVWENGGKSRFRLRGGDSKSIANIYILESVFLLNY